MDGWIGTTLLMRITSFTVLPDSFLKAILVFFILELPILMKGFFLDELQAATRGTPILWEEAEPIMREMSGLILQAKELHYDSATMLMKLKAEMQVLHFIPLIHS